MINDEEVKCVDFYVWEYLQNRNIRFVEKSEIVQNILIKIWKNYDKIDKSRPIKPWLKTVCHNETKNYIRDFCAKQKRENLWSLDKILQSENPPILFSSENPQSLEGELILRLSSKEFLIYCGLTQGESVPIISEKTKITEQTVYGARRRIRKKYKGLL